jgi:hypothetical protein
MNYDPLTVARFGERLRANMYKNVTAARRAVGKANFSFAERENAYRLVNTHFKISLADEAKKKKPTKRRRRPPAPKSAQRNGPPPRASRQRDDWDPVVLADAIVDRLLAHFIGRVFELAQALGALIRPAEPRRRR